MKQYPDLRPRALSGTRTGVSTNRVVTRFQAADPVGYRRKAMARTGSNDARASLLRVYRRLRRRYGPAGWWPAESSLEICVGAILVQNTAWANVERALERLRQRSLVSFDALDRLPASRLAPLLRPSGTFRVKARRLRAFLDFLGAEYGGRVEKMNGEHPSVLRRKLLSVPGIGPETADSIALYAAGKPVFVVGAYTRRVLSRLGLLQADPPGRPSTRHGGYAQVQRYLTDRLPRDAELYNDYHAQLVRLGKEHCRPRPRCSGCPLDDLCPKHGLPAS
jgi:endonuclease-3 related protein